MDRTNITLGSVKSRDILRDSRIFCRNNYGELLKISLPLFATMILYYLLIYNIMWISIKSSDVPILLGLAVLNIPLSLGGSFVISLVMVSYIKRLNAKVRGEELTLKESFKGAAITALKIFGVSMLGVMIIYIPLLVITPFGAITAVIMGGFGQTATVSVLMIVLILLVFTIFLVIFLAWAFYVGIHLMILIQTIIIEPMVIKWFKWCRVLVKGRIKNISGVLAGIYGVILLIIIVVGLPLYILLPSEIPYIILSSVIMMLITLLVYPYMMTSMILLYYRLKSANWEKVSGFLVEEKKKETQRVSVAMQNVKIVDKPEVE